MPHPSNTLTLTSILVRTAVAHTVTYIAVGALAAVSLDYAHAYAAPTVRMLMRQTTDPMVMAGPLFQPIRGVLFGIVLYLLREEFFGRRRGYLLLWVTLTILGIVNTFGPAPGSIEGMIYTILPIGLQFLGLPRSPPADVPVFVARVLLGTASRETPAELDDGNRLLPGTARARPRVAGLPARRAMNGPAQCTMSFQSRS